MCKSIFMAYFQDKTEPRVCSLSLTIKDLKTSGKNVHHHQPLHKQSTPTLLCCRNTYLSSQLRQGWMGQVSCNTGSVSSAWKHRLGIGVSPLFIPYFFPFFDTRKSLGPNAGDAQSPRWLALFRATGLYPSWSELFFQWSEQSQRFAFAFQSPRQTYSNSLFFHLLLSNKFNILALIGDQAFGIMDFTLFPLLLPITCKASLPVPLCLQLLSPSALKFSPSVISFKRYYAPSVSRSQNQNLILSLIALTDLISRQRVLWKVINIYSFQNIPFIAVVQYWNGYTKANWFCLYLL